MGKNCYGFDFDGVIVKIPSVFNFFGKNFEHSVLRLNKFKTFRIVYNNLLEVNSDIKERMNVLKEMGNKIVIISARGECQRKEMEDFLRINNISFDQLVLRDNLDEQIAIYKFRNIIIADCKHYWEDREKNVAYINSRAGRGLAILYPRL